MSTQPQSTREERRYALLLDEIHAEMGRHRLTQVGLVAAPPTWVSIALLALAVATTLFGGVLAGLMLGLYLLPALYASMRPTDWWRFEFSAVALVGILAGWTVVGWVAALVMAVMKDRPPT